jgi:hypothetical protein
VRGTAGPAAGQDEADPRTRLRGTAGLLRGRRRAAECQEGAQGEEKQRAHVLQG